MKKTTLAIATLGMLLGTYAKAQVQVPTANVSLEYPGAGHVTLHISSPANINETVIPTPFLISGLAAPSPNFWLCMDPLQRIYYNGSGEPVGTYIDYPSSNPTDFDKWAPGAPGLTGARVQDIADLFDQFSKMAFNSLDAAALQLAVWEVSNEFDGNGFDLSTGKFQADGNNAEVNLAQTMLDNLKLSSVQGYGNVHALSFLIDGTLSSNSTTLVQDLVGYNPNTINLLIPVPEPSTYGLGAVLGLGLISAIRRRRRARA